MRLSKNYAKTHRNRGAGDGCRGQRAPCAFNKGVFATYLKLQKLRQRGENTFSTRCNPLPRLLARQGVRLFFGGMAMALVGAAAAAPAAGAGVLSSPPVADELSHNGCHQQHHQGQYHKGGSVHSFSFLTVGAAMRRGPRDFSAAPQPGQPFPPAWVCEARATAYQPVPPAQPPALPAAHGR